MRRLLALLALLLAGCAATPEGDAPRALFADGRWTGPIWIPEAPDFEEAVAAEELADWAGRVTGVRPEVRREAGAPARGGIALGRTRLADRADIAAPPGDGERAVRRLWGDTLVIVGNSPVATRMACGRLCEAALGITFVLPAEAGADFVPLATVPVPADETWTPAFAWRAISGMDNAHEIAWARLNGYGSRPRCTHGLHTVFTAELFRERPDLFATLAGKPLPPIERGRSENPRLDHPDAPALAAAQARRWLKANPAELAVPMGINDSVVYPDIEAAWPGRRVVDGRPDRSDFVFGFLNRVASEDWNPGGDRALGALAYLDAQAPPSFPVHPDIFPAVCADRIQYANPAYAAEEAARLAAWGRSGVRRLATWDYWFGRDVPFPRVHIPATVASIRAAAAAGVDSWYAELDPLWIFDAPKVWIGAKLLDDPTRDAAELERRWFAAAYGPAAAPLRELHAGIAACWERAFAERLPGQWLLGWRDGAFVPDDTDGLLGERGDALLAGARAALAAAPDDARHRRMRQRLAQFELAWAATKAQAARTAQARVVIQSGLSATPASLAPMLDAERARNQALVAFNAAKWPGQANLRWEDFAQPNPWPLLVSPSVALPSDAPAAARVAWVAAQRRRAPSSTDDGFAFRGVPGSDSGWRLWAAPPGAFQPTPAGLAALAPQGTLRRNFAVAPGEILRVQVTVLEEPAGGNGATVAIRFPAASKPSPATAPSGLPAAIDRLHPPAPPTPGTALSRNISLVKGVNILELPVRAESGTDALVEISFVDRLPPIGLVEVERLVR